MRFSCLMQYFGVVLLMGCAVALVFTFIFWLLIGMLITLFFLGVAVFACLTLLGYVMVKFKWQDSGDIGDEAEGL